VYQCNSGWRLFFYFSFSRSLNNFHKNVPRDRGLRSFVSSAPTFPPGTARVFHSTSPGYVGIGPRRFLTLCSLCSFPSLTSFSSVRIHPMSLFISAFLDCVSVRLTTFLFCDDFQQALERVVQPLLWCWRSLTTNYTTVCSFNGRHWIRSRMSESDKRDGLCQRAQNWLTLISFGYFGFFCFSFLRETAVGHQK
jgi:hypothetical protein